MVGGAANNARLAMTVTAGRRTKHTEFDLDPGQSIKIALEAMEGASTEKYIHGGQVINDQIARQLLREEEERQRRGHHPDMPHSPPVVQKLSWSRLRTLFKGWTEGKISVQDLYRAGGSPLAHLFAAAAEVEREKKKLLAEPGQDDGTMAHLIPEYEPLMNVAYRFWFQELLDDTEVLHLFGPRVHRHFVVNYNQRRADLEPPEDDDAQTAQERTVTHDPLEGEPPGNHDLHEAPSGESKPLRDADHQEVRAQETSDSDRTD